MDPVSLGFGIVGLFDIALNIVERVDAVILRYGALREAVPVAHQLASRIASLHQPLLQKRKDLQSHPRSAGEMQAITAHIQLLEECMLDCCGFIETMAKEGWMRRFVRADHNIQRFESLNAQLTGCLITVGFTDRIAIDTREQERAIAQTEAFDGFRAGLSALKEGETDMKDELQILGLKQEQYREEITQRIESLGQIFLVQLQRLGDGPLPQPQLSTIDEDAYACAIIRRFGKMLDIADTIEGSDGAAYQHRLDAVFVPQWVQACDRINFSSFELPEESVKLLQAQRSSTLT